MLGGLIRNMFFMLADAEILFPDGTTQEIDLTDGSLDLSSIIEGGSAPATASAVLLALCALLGLVCIGLMVIILLQKKRASGIGAAIAGSGETYYSKNKGKTLEGTLEKYTKWCGAAFIIIALVINILM